MITLVLLHLFSTVYTKTEFWKDVTLSVINDKKEGGKWSVTQEDNS